MKIFKTILAAGATVVAFAVSADAATYGFFNITNNNATDAVTGEAQLSLEVTDGGAGLVNLVFSNSGPLASSITDIYVDDKNDPLLFASLSIFADSGAGVDFSEGAAPPSLPGGNDPAFDFTTVFSADSNPPTQPNGVNPGEFLTIQAVLDGAYSFGDVIASIESGDLRFGIHVQGFEGGGSESFINNPPDVAPIPLPAAGLLLVGGLGGLAMLRKKKAA